MNTEGIFLVALVIVGLTIAGLINSDNNKIHELELTIKKQDSEIASCQNKKQKKILKDFEASLVDQ